MSKPDNNTNSIFETEIIVRPDDIDMNNHVHNSKYLDYIQTARFIQMRDNYKVPMEEYFERGYTWFASEVQLKYKREMKFGDIAVVKTQVDEWSGAQVTINVWVYNKATNKVCVEGKILYTLVSISSGRPTRIPEDIIERHKI
ncbi:MAG TPA: acyl-CoA thioesterase [Ignavibacteriaceae bacterium]|jgi:acyl-CoA thioester hydrolase/thioesterase-3|nr:MAG: bifunctional 3-hydroxyacyl-CoA dehydrogenase/thioesterase [Ignavibacteria bacterium ADurb.Bin266]OQY70446.1 MAG: thioesterase [Ignavibacteriales bacterium UTCHB2]HQF43649.1 acyl-CoA thioesterase [Ignavibacteriaceae bacterium]HQI42243.1 acyl-CoA thioesterase [Ignavibacteriaceae bacterium]HQJ45372.1 acyl-CoA thioesterase [Ignavibacteriaceae bacterium]